LGVTRAFESRWIDFDTHVAWVGEVTFFRHKRVVVMIDPWWRDLTFWTFPGASADEIADAMARVRQVLPRQDAMPTRPLPRVAEAARL